jgi:peroxiredoxin
MTTTNDHLRSRDQPIKVGDPAPDFVLPDQDKKEVRLSDLVKQGKTVALSFFPMAFTSVCGSEMQAYSRDRESFEDKNAVVLGVSCDSYAAQKAWAEKEGLTTEMLADMHRRVCKAYGFYLPDMNVCARGTVVIKPAPDNKAAAAPGMSGGVVTWVSARALRQEVKVSDVLAAVA